MKLLANDNKGDNVFLANQRPAFKHGIRQDILEHFIFLYFFHVNTYILCLFYNKYVAQMISYICNKSLYTKHYILYTIYVFTYTTLNVLSLSLTHIFTHYKYCIYFVFK